MDIGYAAAHARVRKLWGPARNHPCTLCPEPAAGWAYDGTDPTELSETLPKRIYPYLYSQWPEFYLPLCKSCHRRQDLKKLPRAYRCAYDRTARNEPTPRTPEDWDKWHRTHPGYLFAK